MKGVNLFLCVCTVCGAAIAVAGVLSGSSLHASVAWGSAYAFGPMLFPLAVVLLFRGELRRLARAARAVLRPEEARAR